MSAEGGDDRSPFDAYLDGVASQLANRGYTQRRDGPPNYRTTVFHRRTLSLTKFGLVDYFVVVAPFEELEPQDAAAFSAAAFRFGLDNKSALPRGLGGNLVVFPVVVGENLPNAVHQWVRGYREKHWASFEFPVVADLGTGALSYNAEKPLWGRAYYNGFQKLVTRCLSPALGSEPPANPSHGHTQPRG